MMAGEKTKLNFVSNEEVGLIASSLKPSRHLRE